MDTSSLLATPFSPSFSPAAISLSDPRTSPASPYSSSLFPYLSTTSPFASPFASPVSSPPSPAGFSVEASTAGGFGRGFDGAEHAGNAGCGIDEADDLVDECASTSEAAFTPRRHYPTAPAPSPAPSFSFPAAPAPAPHAPEPSSTRADFVECGRGVGVVVGRGAVEGGRGGGGVERREGPTKRSDEEQEDDPET
ncbi:hypothetical protein JCM8097_002943 [Rhodosporidiobolus ruineniae]